MISCLGLLLLTYKIRRCALSKTIFTAESKNYFRKKSSTQLLAMIEGQITSGRTSFAYGYHGFSRKSAEEDRLAYGESNV